MKKNVRLALLFALIAVMVVMTAVFASAATVTDADGFKAAVAAGGEITLGDNITLNEGIVIDKNVTIKGDGHTITFTAGTALETAISNQPGNASREVRNYAFNIAGGTVVFENVTVVAPKTGKPADDAELTADAMVGILTFTGVADVTLNGFVTEGGYYPVMLGAAATLTVNDGTVLGTNAGYHYAMGSSGDAVPTVVINGGKLTNKTSSTGDLTRFQGSANLTINGGELESVGDGIYFFGGAGNFTMTAGTITATGSAVNVSGSTVTGTVTITGGTFTGYTGAKIGTSGASSIKNATLIATNCILINNSGSVEVEDCNLLGNGSGACVYVQHADCKSITVKNSKLYGYAGLRFTQPADGGTYTLQNCIFRPQYTGTYDPDADGMGISDWCTNGTILRVHTSDETLSPKNCTFNIIGCDLNNTVYGTGENRVELNNITGGYCIINDYASKNNTWNLTDCTITWQTTSTTTFNTPKTSTVNMTNCTASLTATGNAYMFNWNNAASVTVTGGSYKYLSGGTYMARVSDGNVYVTLTDVAFEYNGTGSMLELNNGKQFFVDSCTMTHNNENPMLKVGNHSGPLNAKDSTFSSNAVTLDLSQGTHPVVLLNSTVDNIAIVAGYAGTVALTDVTCSTLTDPDGIAVITTTAVKFFELNGVAMTWDEAMAALQAGDVIKIIGAVDWSLDLDTDVAFTIDFNGYTVLAPTFYAHTNVTFKNYIVTADSGTALTVAAGTTLTLGEGCVITSTNFGSLNYETNVVDKTGGYAISNAGNLIINAGATINGTINAGGTVVINGGTFRNGSYTHSGSGGVCRADKPLVWMNGSGDLTINGGDFEATFDAYQADGEANSLICTNDGNANITITGGTFTAHGGHAAYLYSNSSVTITGGTFTTDMADKAPLYIGTMHGKRYDASRATELKNFTTVGGNCGVQFKTNYEWHFTVGDITVTDATEAMFCVENISADGEIIFTGRYTFACDAAEAAVLKVAGNSTVILDGAVIVNNCETSTAAIVVSGETAVLTVKNAAILGNTGAAYKTDAETVAFGAAKVKLFGATYSLWMAATGEADASLDDGASVRVETGSEGIRFTGSATKVEGATYGIMIAPADFVAAAGAFTKEALDAFAAEKGLTAGQVYQMVTASNSLKDNGETVSFSVALVNIKTTNANRAFAAVTFVTVGDVTTYGDYDSTVNTATMAAIAQGALADTKTAAEIAADPALAAAYTYEIETGVFSKYNADTRAALAAYVA